MCKTTGNNLEWSLTIDMTRIDTSSVVMNISVFRVNYFKPDVVQKLLGACTAYDVVTQKWLQMTLGNFWNLALKCEEGGKFIVLVECNSKKFRLSYFHQQ